MADNSRITKSLKNARVALIFYLLNLILQFFYRKVFLVFLGAEVLGLNTTAMNLLQFLNLAELGVGAAISYSLYKPLSTNNHNTVNEIVSIQGYLYSRIGIIVSIAAIVMMLFFPIFFSDLHIPFWYTYTTFGVLLVSALIGYFLNYQQIILVSDQKEYKLNYALQGIKVIKVGLQIVAITYLSHKYVSWLFLEIIAIFFTVWGIKFILRREYPWLKTNISAGKKLIQKHPEITLKTKQLFTHKIAGFALNESSPLIIFAFTSLSFIASYGNYLLVVMGVTALLSAILNSTNAGVGNLVSEGNRERINNVFTELFTVRFFLASIACFCVYKLTPIFITLWVGKQYVLSNYTLFLLVLMMFINISRLTVDSFLNAYGLFNDIAAPIVETALNISLSIALGYFFGIDGVLIGVLISLAIIVLCWKPYFLYKSGFRKAFKTYVYMYSKLFILAAIVFLVCDYSLCLLHFDAYSSILRFILYSCFTLFCSSSLLFIAFLIFSGGMRQFYKRLKMILIR